MSSLADIKDAHGQLTEHYNRFRDELGIKDELKLGQPNLTYGMGDERDLHLEAPQGLPVVFMGFNPGDGNGSKVQRVTPSEKAWRTRCSKLAGVEPHRIVFTELICVATRKAADIPTERLEEL